jgi:cell division protein FtsB
MTADDLIRYAKPSTDLEYALMECLRDNVSILERLDELLSILACNDLPTTEDELDKELDRREKETKALEDEIEELKDERDKLEDEVWYLTNPEKATV